MPPPAPFCVSANAHVSPAPAAIATHVSALPLQPPNATQSALGPLLCTCCVGDLGDLHLPHVPCPSSEDPAADARRKPKDHLRCACGWGLSTVKQRQLELDCATCAMTTLYAACCMPHAGCETTTGSGRRPPHNPEVASGTCKDQVDTSAVNTTRPTWQRAPTHRVNTQLPQCLLLVPSHPLVATPMSGCNIQALPHHDPPRPSACPSNTSHACHAGAPHTPKSCHVLTIAPLHLP